jgi:hypothetical protein
MPITDIIEIRILPAFAIARMGSSPEPMDNYDWEVTDRVGFRKLVPAPTFHVDPKSGRILSLKKPQAVRFRDAKNRIRPVAPFLEVWARFKKSGPLVPLTTHHLKALGLTTASLEWRVLLGNNKAFRRTRDLNDKVLADTGHFNDHGKKNLFGKCKNFINGKKIPFGHVRFIKPTAQFPEIRFRFTPAGGHVYGPPIPKEVQHDSGGRIISQPLIKEAVYDPKKGIWDRHSDNGRDQELITAPDLTYANDSSKNDRSLGYLDDGGDGLVELTLKLKNKNISAYGRIVSGPPAFAPDGVPIRTFADELEQALLGPQVSGPPRMDEVKDIVRRAFETVRLINTTIMNFEDGMAGMDNGGFGRFLAPIMDENVVDNLAIRARHELVLLSLESGSLAWFARVLRQYNEVGDLTDEGRRKMPAMMRGADGSHLALTRRMLNKIILAADLFHQHKPKPKTQKSKKQPLQSP